MRATYDEIASYLANLAGLMERHGILLRPSVDGEDLIIGETADGSLSFELLGDLPHGVEPASRISVREAFAHVAPGRYERSRYEYELLDVARDYRRAFHLHSPDWFERTHLVVVHEHCERPIGRVDCEHFEGTPIKDGYAGIGVLMTAWTGAPPDCSTLPCLDHG